MIRQGECNARVVPILAAKHTVYFSVIFLSVSFYCPVDAVGSDFPDLGSCCFHLEVATIYLWVFLVPEEEWWVGCICVMCGGFGATISSFDGEFE